MGHTARIEARKYFRRGTAMNIQQAKEQVKYALKAYFTKDDRGHFIIPIERQRPIFLMGPPGIGKTAIMEQIASELGVGLVSYSMTHHTRQSALGLPYIVKKTYGGDEYSVSEYTMSEIIASVYEMIETGGISEGILFLDEVNCVSETLAPAMLQFLQFKIFGRHRVPDGWIVVTAGNPPEYNNSVREFDIVTWDRLKRIDVEPDYPVWRSYALEIGIHPAITTYLEIIKDHFYSIETTVDGKSFVTARGWVDLSDMIRLYEKHHFKVDETLMEQYLQNQQIARKFAVYYDLFNKYKSDYQVESILNGQVPESIKQRARDAQFDERLSLLGLILDRLNQQFRSIRQTENKLEEIMNQLRKERQAIVERGATYAKEKLDKIMVELLREIETGKQTKNLSSDQIQTKEELTLIYEKMLNDVTQLESESGEDAFDIIKRHFDFERNVLEQEAENVGANLENTFSFLEDVFPDGQELLIFVTELTANRDSAAFIGRYGSERYFRHNQELLFYERQTEIIRELKLLEL